MSKLKPCPFCGGEAELEKAGGGVFETWYVTCATCCASVWENTEAEAIEAWNTRREVLYIKPIEDGNGHFTSNRCGRCLEWLGYDWNYCPKCGVRVREKTDAER